MPTRYSPVRHSCTPEGALPYDLHVLGTPPAFVLSQDQTLQFEPCPVSHTLVCNPGRSESDVHDPRVVGAAWDFGPLAVLRASLARKTARYSVFKDPAKPPTACIEPRRHQQHPSDVSPPNCFETCGLGIYEREGGRSRGAAGQKSGGPRGGAPHSIRTRANRRFPTFKR